MPFLNHATLHQNDISVGFDMAKGVTWEISRSSSLPIAVVWSRSSFFAIPVPTKQLIPTWYVFYAFSQLKRQTKFIKQLPQLDIIDLFYLCL